MNMTMHSARESTTSSQPNDKSKELIDEPLAEIFEVSELAGSRMAYLAEWDYARQLLDSEINELTRSQKRAMDILRFKYEEAIEILKSPKQEVQAEIIRCAQALALVKGASDEMHKIIQTEMSTDGNLIVITRLGDAMERNLGRRVIFDEELKDRRYQQAVALLKEKFDDEEVELILCDKERMLNFYSHIANRSAKAGLDVLEMSLGEMAEQLIAVIGEGNYFFNLTGDNPDPFEVDDSEFCVFLYEAGMHPFLNA
jgi:ssRNA-specific RNase YbeY (16S rRNA maturation enzyme)